MNTGPTASILCSLHLVCLTGLGRVWPERSDASEPGRRRGSMRTWQVILGGFCLLRVARPTSNSA